MFKLDPEIAAAFAAMAQTGSPLEQRREDIAGMREVTNTGLAAIFSALPNTPEVETQSFEANAADGSAIPLTWYAKPGTERLAAVVYVHGGGMIAGSAAIYDRLVRHYVALSGVGFLAVGYRLAPEHRETGLARDVVSAIAWLRAKAAALDVDPERIAIMGDSGGGGVAAAAAIMARDTGFMLARQILIYPMLDDRNCTPDPLLVDTSTWSYEKNRVAWAAVLGDVFGTAAVLPTVAPARLDRFDGLPPAYIEVGELDIFRDESIAYAQRLLAAGISCELHVHPGAPHGHDWINLDADISRRVFADRTRVLRSL